MSGSRTIHKGRVFEVTEDTVQLSNGNTVKRDVVRHPGAIVVIPKQNDGKLLLVSQFRHPAGTTLLEFPAGTLEPGEAPQACAEREIIEEAGYKAARWHDLGAFYSAPGFCNELLFAYLASELEPASAEQDEDEEIQVAAMTITEFERAAARGEIKDAKTLGAFFLARVKGLV